MKEVPVSWLAGKSLLIDGDILLYRCGFAVDKSGEDFREAIDVTINSIRRVSPESKYEIWLSGPHNFREIIATIKPYKGNRVGKPKPKKYKEIGEYLRNKHGANWTTGYEADDQLAILLSADPARRVICSNDKDFRQVSGWHYDWTKDRAYWVSRKAGDFALYTQVLAGDPTDHVGGITGIGSKKAEAILEGSRSSAELCRRSWLAYRDHGLSRDNFIENARLVYLLRGWDDHLPLPFMVDSTYEAI